MKERWGIDFKRGVFSKKATDAGIDNTHFFWDAHVEWDKE